MQKCAFSFFYLLINKWFREIKCQSQEEQMQEKRLHLHYFMPTYTLPLENGSFLIKILDVQKLKMAIYKGLVILKVVKIPQNQGT